MATNKDLLARVLESLPVAGRAAASYDIGEP